MKGRTVDVRSEVDFAHVVGLQDSGVTGVGCVVRSAVI